MAKVASFSPAGVSIEIEATLCTQPLRSPELTQKAGEADLNSVQQPPRL